MPRIAVLEPDPIIALDIAKTIERGRLADVDVFSRIDEILGDPRTLNYELFIVDIGDDQQSVIDGAVRIHRDLGIYCLVISDHTISSSLAKLREAEPLGVLVKPFSSRELTANVEAALYRASMEKKLRDSERRYRNLFAYSLSARCVVDSEGTILERNRAFASSFATSEKMSKIQDMFLEEEQWAEILASLHHNQVFQEEIHTRDVGQGQRDLVCNFSFFQEEPGKANILCEFVDITESKRLREELFQSQKLEAIGRLAGGVAHDLNNFMTSMLGFLEMVKMELPPDSAAQEDVQGIERVVQKTSALTKQLLGFSRPKSYAPSTVDLRDVLNDGCKIFKRLLPERISLSLGVPEEPVFASVDAGHIEQILLNLVVNARDALEKTENPRIFIQLDIQEDDASPPPRGQYALIQVKDNGVGIDARDITKIFDPFFTTKEADKGTGLGLSIVKSLTELNGGHITVDSTVGSGTTFSIWLPRLQNPASLNGAEERRISTSTLVGDTLSNALEHTRILIVDDDASVLESCARVLGRVGASVETCINAGEAFLLAERLEFDLMIADVVLPGMYGTELWKRLQRDGRIAACLFMTGYESHELDLPQGVHLLYKPFDARALLKACTDTLTCAGLFQQRRTGLSR
jgi:PAS domain S-box-containing protein